VVVAGQVVEVRGERNGPLALGHACHVGDGASRRDARRAHSPGRRGQPHATVDADVNGASELRCPACHAPRLAEDHFCERCGARLKARDAVGRPGPGATPDHPLLSREQRGAAAPAA